MPTHCQISKFVDRPVVLFIKFIKFETYNNRILLGINNKDIF